MEIMELAEMKKMFLPSENRYITPHKEAMQLRTLWSYYKLPNRMKNMKKTKSLYAEACKHMERNMEPSRILVLIRVGLKLDPRFHPLYALKGDIYFKQETWSKALHSYECARALVRFDKKIPESKVKTIYNEKLIQVYYQRANAYNHDGYYLEALSDLEQILVLKPRRHMELEVQDKLLSILRKLEKYEAFRLSWSEFMRNVDPIRASALLTRHGEYKIYLREMATARHILYEAIDLDPDNGEAQALLQVVFDTGHNMVTFAIIWCQYGYYDKALLCIDKGTDCNPYNPGYTLLRAIILRLSGRLEDAAKWLNSVDKGFYKFLEPTRDRQGSIMGSLTTKQTKFHLKKQWHLIRYDLAIACMLDNRYSDAYNLLHDSVLRELYPETYILLGDCLFKRGAVNGALEMYLKCQKMCRNMESWNHSRKKDSLMRRVATILNGRARQAVQNKHGRVARRLSAMVLQIFDEQTIDLAKLGAERSEALMYGARGLYQESLWNRIPADYYTSAADSLSFARGIDDGGLYGTIYGEKMPLEEVVDNYASKKELPCGTKLLMQYS